MSKVEQLDPKVGLKIKSTLETVGAAMKELGILSQQHDFPPDTVEKIKVYVNGHTKELFTRLQAKNIDTTFSID